nr:hypothetical protein GTC16762_31470 [Pigmentibacter ruber]
MFSVTFEDAMENLEEMVEKACLANFSFVITKNGVPCARVVPVHEEELAVITNSNQVDE